MQSMKTLSVLATGLFIAVAASAFAEGDAPAPATTAPVPAATAVQPATTPATPVAQATPVEGELKDGTKVEFGTDGTVSIVNVDGTKTPAPDGVHTLRDNTTFAVKDGKKVVE